MQLNPIEKKILDTLTNSDNGMTAYQISKKIELSWNTTEKYLWRLHGRGKINYHVVKQSITTEKRLWSLRK